MCKDQSVRNPILWQRRAWIAIAATMLMQASTGIAQSDIEAPPIRYSETADNNPMSKLMAEIQAGVTTLPPDPEHGYLPALLKQLAIPINSQSLVFSKTSMQTKYISHQNPRAIYFNDDVYVGWVRGSSLLEISTADPKLGAAFYTIVMTPRKPYINRVNYDCLACHQTSLTQGVPGHTMRSVHAYADGRVAVQKESFVTDDQSPFAERYGGWFVTIAGGELSHMGNAVLQNDELPIHALTNRSSLVGEFETADWLSPHSDIVALLVLGHQTQMHNTLTAANFAVRRAEHEHALAYPDSSTVDRTDGGEEAQLELQTLIDQAASRVVDKLLFVGEAPIPTAIQGSTDFADAFRQRGPFDREGRSLREFDLHSRVFRYPCSYLIYSDSFKSLEESLRQRILNQLHDRLTTDTPPPKDAHLDRPTRVAIRQILTETLADLPAEWGSHE
jgi:hypothetical protein